MAIVGPCSAPPFFRCRRRDACADLRQPAARRALALELGEELAIGGDQRAGATHDEGDLVIAVALIDQERNTCECGDIVLDGTESMVQPAGDFVGLLPLEVETDGL